MQEPFGAFTWSAIAAGSPTGRPGNTFSYQSAIPMASYLQTLAVG
ncbi:hypothetical protein [Actinoplanes subtropicus]|nr:hypothetical protein [Actinoplanes subtropicus]